MRTDGFKTCVYKRLTTPELRTGLSLKVYHNLIVNKTVYVAWDYKLVFIIQFIKHTGLWQK